MTMKFLTSALAACTVALSASALNWDNALIRGTTPGWRPAGMQRQTVDVGELLREKSVVYHLDASARDSLVLDGNGRVTSWSSANGNGFVFRPSSPAGAPACTNTLNGLPVVSFGAAGANGLVGSCVTTQRTVFLVCRPRGCPCDFSGVWGAKGAETGLRMSNRSCAWENVNFQGVWGGPNFNSAGPLMVNGGTHTGAVPFAPGSVQVVAMRHDRDSSFWGATSRAVFTPALGTYLGGRFFDGDVAELIAFDRLLSIGECRDLSRRLLQKWDDGFCAFDPFDSVREQIRAGKRLVTVPKGVYTVAPKDGGAYLSLKGLSDVIVDFAGSEIRGKVTTGFFRLEDCTNVTVRNVTLDYSTLPFTQGEIIASDKDRTWTVKLIPGYPVPPDGGEGNWPFQVYDRKSLELKNPMRCWGGFRIEKTGPDTYRVSGGNDRRGEVGDYVVWGMPPPKGAIEGDHVSERDVVYCRATVHCIFENVIEYATPGGRAFEEHLAEANEYRACQIVRRPPETDFMKRGLKRLRSGNHDAFMSRRAVVGPKILGCTAMYHCDDAVNISGMYGVVYSVDGKKVRLLEYIPSVFHVGDTTQAMSLEGEPLPEMKVTAVRAGCALTDAERAYLKTIGLWRGLDANCRSAVEIEVDDAAALKRGDAVVSNRAQGNGFEIRGCRFGRNRAFCVRLRASHGTVADNVFDRSEGCGLFVGPEYEWLEGGLAEDVRIEDNVFLGCGLHFGGAAAHRKRLPREAYRNVTVTNNLMSGSAETPDAGSPVGAAVPAVRTAWLDPIAYIRAQLARGARHVSVPKARYWLMPEPNKSTYLELVNERDVTIDFNGGELVGGVATGMLGLRACTNVTIRNVSIDYAELPFTQAVIEKVDVDRNWDVRVLPGYPCPDDAQLKGGDDAFWPIQAYDAKTHEPKNFMRFRDGVAIARTGRDTYRITGGQNRTGDVGDIAVWSIREVGRPIDASAVSAGSCARCTFENVTVYSTPHGCGFAEGSADANVYRNCRLVRRPVETDLFSRAMPRLRSGNHDAFNSRCSYRGPRLEGCTFQYHCDDCVNISGFYAIVVGQKGREVRIAPYGSLRIAAGDTCQLLTFGGQCLPDAKIVSVEPDGPTTAAERRLFENYNLWPGLCRNLPHAYKAMLDSDAVLPTGSVLISTRRMGNGFVIRNCTMGHNRARGFLIKASDGVIANNVLEGVEGYAVQISPEYEWMEGGCSRNLKVAGNVFRQNGGGVLLAGNNGARKPLPADSHRDIAITGNRIEGCRRGIDVVGCTGLDLRGNDIRLRPDSKKPPVTLKNVADVRR